MPKKYCKAPFALLLLPLALILSGCGEGGTAGLLRSSGAVTTPDEFLVLPTRPLEMPDDLAALPVPTPGQPSLVDYDPEAIAIAGLTGTDAPARTASGSALLARVGVAANTPGIRLILAEENVTYRQSHRGRVLERMFSKNRDALVYRQMILDPAPVYETLRARGVRVPAPPPDFLNGNN